MFLMQRLQTLKESVTFYVYNGFFYFNILSVYHIVA